MSRIRTVKPEFWRHEDLSALPESTHMLAAQLLNYADDEGYFNANPNLIQAEVSPLRAPSVSIQESLTKLARVGFLQLGVGADGRRYGHIVKFLDHQRINRPTKSKIKEIQIVWEQSETPHTLFTEPSHPEGKGMEQGMEQGMELARSADAYITPAIQAYNLVAEEHDWPKAQNITDKRKRALRARLAECGGIEGWNAAMQRARASPFLRGETGRDAEHEKWVPDLDFFLQQSSFTKLMEGKYDDRTKPPGASGIGAVAAGIAASINAQRAA